jgi:uncharacterized hydrophobic protein (TIGR00341 family)
MRQSVLDVLDEEGIDYVVTDEDSGRDYTGVVYFPLPSNAVEPVLQRLHDIGLDDQAYTVVLAAETVVSRKFEQLRESYEEESEGHERIARQELKTRAEDLASTSTTYVAMTTISAVVATAGLLLDSPATVVGSMVIAPLVGPAMAGAVGTVIDDSELFRRGLEFQVLGLVLTVVAAAVFTKAVDVLNFIPATLEPATIAQVRERLAPDFLSLVIALGAGTAGAISLTAGVSTALVGVMIAVALVPPAATVGIGIAYGDPHIAIASGVLAVVNGLSINLAALAVLWYVGYRPSRLFRMDQARTATLRRVAIIVVAIAVLSVFLGGVTYDSYRSAQTSQAIEDAVEPAFQSGGAYADLVLLETTVEFTPQQPVFLFNRPHAVSLTVGVPPDAQTEGLLQLLERRVHTAADSPIEVQIRYVQYERS